MPAYSLRAAALAACCGFAGCSSISDASRSFVSAITPHKMEVVQGNFVSREQVQALQPGMSRQQVRDLLGSPLITDMFHASRWDYVFTLKRKGVASQQHRLSVFFKDDLLERFDSDEMPTEAEFVTALDSRKNKGKPPPLQASDEQLAKFPPPALATPNVNANAAGLPRTTDTAQGDAATSYPPLEQAVLR